MDTGMTVYDFNKQIYEKMTPITGENLDAAISNLCAWFGSRQEFQYFMLNNYELKWFTIFNIGKRTNYHNVFVELKEVLNNIGIVLAIEYQHDMAYYEIWMRCAQDDQVHMFVLFNCNDLVVEVK